MHQPHPDALTREYDYLEEKSARVITDCLTGGRIITGRIAVRSLSTATMNRPREWHEAHEAAMAHLSRPKPQGVPGALCAMHQPLWGVLWYVTLIPHQGGSAGYRMPPKATAFLLGPFTSKAEAEASVRRGKTLAEEWSSRHSWDIAGVSSLPEDCRPRVHFALDQLPVAWQPIREAPETPIAKPARRQASRAARRTTEPAEFALALPLELPTFGHQKKGRRTA